MSETKFIDYPMPQDGISYRKSQTITIAPPLIKVHTLPDWLETEIQQVRSRELGKRISKRKAVSDVLNGPAVSDCFNRRWLDHWGTGHHFNRAVGFCLISEPYGFDSDAAKSLDTFCAKYRCNWEVGATSNHYPTKTVRIVVYRECNRPA